MSSGRSSSCARRLSSCDHARSTERMVPSRGSCRAEYADSVPLTAAAANCGPSAWRSRSIDEARPCRNCAKIAPELPRAPSRAPSAATRAASPTESGASLPSLEAAALSVAARLAPVSASRTGKTLMRFRLSCSRTTASAPARTTRENTVPLSFVVSSALWLMFPACVIVMPSSVAQGPFPGRSAPGRRILLTGASRPHHLARKRADLLQGLARGGGHGAGPRRRERAAACRRPPGRRSCPAPPR